VTVWRIVAAPDVAAFETQAQMNPLRAHGEALLAAARRFGFDRLDLGEMGAASGVRHEPVDSME
jgi:hypothetical protein